MTVQAVAPFFVNGRRDIAIPTVFRVDERSALIWKTVILKMLQALRAAIVKMAVRALQIRGRDYKGTEPFLQSRIAHIVRADIRVGITGRKAPYPHMATESA